MTQFAWSRFEPAEYCEKHFHTPREDYFFVYKGNGSYEIGDELFDLTEADFIRIPANTTHKLLVVCEQK